MQTVSTIEVMPDSSLSPSQIVEKRCIALTKALEQNYQKRYPNFNSKKIFKMELGRKYWKVIQDNSSVHAFIDRNTGEVYKPAGWKSPAKIVRYDLRLISDRAKLHDPKFTDWAGGYLYLR